MLYIAIQSDRESLEADPALARPQLTASQTFPMGGKLVLARRLADQ